MNVKKLNKNYKKKIDSRKGVLLASYSRKKTRRRKKGKDGSTNGNDQVNYTKNTLIKLVTKYLFDSI